MRRRDFQKEPEPNPIEETVKAVAAEIVRLENIVAESPPPDLTPLEAQLRTMRAEVQDLRSILAQMPRTSQQATNYRFVVHRRDDQLIDYVDGIALSRNPTIMERAAAHLH